NRSASASSSNTRKTSDRNPDPDPLDKSHNPHLDQSLSTKAQASKLCEPKIHNIHDPCRRVVSFLSLVPLPPTLPCAAPLQVTRFTSVDDTRSLPTNKGFLTAVSVFRVSLTARNSERGLVVPARSTDFHPSIHRSIQTVKVSIPRRFFSSPTTTTTSKSTQSTYWRRFCTSQRYHQRPNHSPLLPPPQPAHHHHTTAYGHYQRFSTTSPPDLNSQRRTLPGVLARAFFALSLSGARCTYP
ncbi:hypothetical protein CABS01_07961, partial [Colletotrichum abscissum]|uniref:uncharacterized protein n=1 Tax=Colletotrichum abscissum TaxID=1671311 RepID=UPI0027D4A68A